MRAKDSSTIASALKVARKTRNPHGDPEPIHHPEYALPAPEMETPENMHEPPSGVKTASMGKVHSGPIHSHVAGRTDHLPMHVASGSYVIPADIISSMGEGNTLAGFKIANSIFEVEDQVGGKPYVREKTPYGAEGKPYGATKTPYGMARATGGKTGDGHAVPIVAAGGEYVIPPESVVKIGLGSLTNGHKVLDSFIKKMRARTIKTLQKLPGPKKG